MAARPQQDSSIRVAEMTKSKVGVIGHHTWFSNHFPEHWETDPNILCLDVDEFDYRFLIHMINFKPELTLFYRPELYPKRYVEQIPGRRIAFLSEPLPCLRNGILLSSEETSLRRLVYRGMNWDCYHDIIYYDSGKRETVEALGWPVTAFRPLPIDTRWFKPGRSQRPIDVCFLGKATSRRIAAMDFLRLEKWNFVWVAHGLKGRQLAALFRRSKVVLNIHADTLPAMEPRVHLAAACGCLVLSEPIAADLAPFERQVIQYHGDLSSANIRNALEVFRSNTLKWQNSSDYLKLSTRLMLKDRVADWLDRFRGTTLSTSPDFQHNSTFG